ncbi:MAG: hypothetical protein ACREBE_10430, partial [bacterium]
GTVGQTGNANAPTTVPNANPSSTPNPSPTANQGAASVADQLRALIDDSKVPAKAESVLQKVGKLEPQASGSEASYLVAAIRSNVYAYRNDTTTACKVLKEAIPKLNADDKDRVGERQTVLSCQP